MNVTQAHEAVRHANTVIAGCENIDELDEASNIETAYKDCPSDFTDEMKDLAQRVILDAYLESIGRG